MTEKQEITKEERIIAKEKLIRKEQLRLKKLFKNSDENKQKLVIPLIEKAAFMSIELEELQNEIIKNGWTEKYQNGQFQKGVKKSAAGDNYIALSKNYTAIIKQLTELVPLSKRKESKLEALRRE